jgi:ParB family chromosome partitioning protein
MSYQRLMDECDLTQEKMAQRVGKKRASVANYLRLLKLPAKVQHDLKAGLLSTGHAKVLLGVEDPHIQELLCDLTIKEGLSVRQLEEKVRKLGKEETIAPAPRTQDLPDDYYRILEHIGKFFDNSISLKRSPSGKGTMTIRFNSDEEVRKFLKVLEDSNI